MKELTKENITHQVEWEGMTFWFIVDQVPLSSLKYSLGRLIAQNYRKHDMYYDTAENDLKITEYVFGPVELPRVFRNINDMEMFFMMFD